MPFVSSQKARSSSKGGYNTELNTASQIISFAKKLEEDSAKLYQDLAERCGRARETLLSFAEENRKDIVQIERTYYEVISDAIEGCFSFKVDPDEYTFNTKLVDNTSYSDALHMAIDIEQTIMQFYSAAAEQSQSLLADVPRLFTKIAKKRDDRKLKVELLLRNEQH